MAILFIIGSLPLIAIIVFVLIVVFMNVSKKKQSNDFSLLTSDSNFSKEGKLNKVINISLTGGLIGMFGSSPMKRLSDEIRVANAHGWNVVRVIPSESGNLFLTIFRLFLLWLTCFLFTTANGFYVVLEKDK